MSSRRAVTAWILVFSLTSGGILLAQPAAPAEPAPPEAVPVGRQVEPAGPAPVEAKELQSSLSEEDLQVEGLTAETAPRAAASQAPESVLDPELLGVLNTEDPVRVYLLLRADVHPGGPDPWKIKQQHMAGIRSVSQEIRDLDSLYHPQGSRAAVHDTAAAARMRATMPAADAVRLDDLRHEADRRMDTMRREVGLATAARVGAAQNAVTGQIQRLGGKLIAAVVSGNVLIAELPGHALADLADHPLVAGIAPVHEGAPALNVSQQAIKAATWYNAGFTGGAYDVGVADTGVQQNHPAFAGVVFYNNTGSPTDPAANGHGTHVAGIITSRDSFNQGIAYGLDAMLWGPAGGSAFTTMDWGAIGAAQAAEVFNMSWNYAMATDVDYNYEDRWFDVYTDYYDILVVFATGNAGWSDTGPTINHPTTGYNTLSVASMADLGTVGRSDDIRRSDSSVGPSLAGRRKPDVAAPGNSIGSTNVGWTGNNLTGGGCGTTNPNDFCVQGGTSMAAPHVAGGVVLMTDGGVLDPMAQKAILINTADWWTSNNTQTTADDGQVTTPPSTSTMWDKSYGWGYIDMDHAYTHRNDYFIGTVIPRNDTALEDDYKLYKGTMLAGDSATLVWHRRGLRGADWPDDKFDSSVFNLTDLNLRLFDESTGALLDGDFAVIDTVHQVQTLADANVVIKVDAWSTAFDGASTEQFALATESGFVGTNFPDEFTGYAAWPSEVEPNEEFDVSFWVLNRSLVACHATQFDLSLPPGFTLVSGADIQTDPAIAANGYSTIATWTIRAPSTPIGPSSVVIDHTHTSYQETYGPLVYTLNFNVQWDTTPPSPNPLTWHFPPEQSGTNALTMTTTDATDVHATRYFFDFIGSGTGGGGANDAWRADSTYLDQGLGTNHSYCYRAYAQDYATTPNSTGYTPTACAYTGIQPSDGPDFVNIFTNAMHLRSLNTPSGLTRGLSGLNIYNDTQSTETGWHQNNNTYVFGGMTPNTAYAFWTQSRNGDGWVTSGSDGVVRYTLAVPPVALGAGPYLDDVTVLASVDPADANPAGTQYLFENTTLGTSSGWTSATDWVETTLACGATYAYYARARNAEGVETSQVFLGNATAGLDTDLDGTLNCFDDDDDNDGFVDLADCAPLDSTSWAQVSPIKDLVLTHVGGLGGTTTMTWGVPSEPGTLNPLVYDVISTGDASAWDDMTAACEETSDTDLTAGHMDDPDPGQAFFFLGRGKNTCGNGHEGQLLQGGVLADRTGVRNCSSCLHDTCVEGAPLDPGCDPCVAAICAVDSYCCTTAWDSICVDEVASVCGGTCP